MTTILADGDLTLRPLGPGELGELVRILQDPTVAHWWGDYDASRVDDEYGDGADGETVVYLLDVRGEIAGFIQYAEEDDPTYRHAGIDIAIRAEFQGRGLGPRAIRCVARHLFNELGHHRLTIDPAAANRNAIRAYEAVGFKPVGLMRKYERGRDGTWHDGLLMDLLAEEFMG